MTPRSHFSASDNDVFMTRKGKAFVEGKVPCQWKLCIAATDEDYLVELLFTISEREDCYFVKYSPADSPKCRDGMMLGRIFLTTKEATGKLWAELYTDSKIMCSLQDDDATERFR